MEWILTGEDSTTENAFSFDLEAVKQEQGLIRDGSPLDAEKTDFVAMYRLLPSHVREDMFEQVFCLYRKYAEISVPDILPPQNRSGQSVRGL